MQEQEQPEGERLPEPMDAYADIYGSLGLQVCPVGWAGCAGVWASMPSMGCGGWQRGGQPGGLGTCNACTRCLMP